MNRTYATISPYWTVAEPSADYDNYSVILSRYADDLYKLLLKKLSQFEALTQPSEQDAEALRGVFDEFVKVTKMLKGKEF